jgi:hypothetical protein
MITDLDRSVSKILAMGHKFAQEQRAERQIWQWNEGDAGVWIHSYGSQAALRRALVAMASEAGRIVYDAEGPLDTGIILRMMQMGYRFFRQRGQGLVEATLSRQTGGLVRGWKKTDLTTQDVQNHPQYLWL